MSHPIPMSDEGKQAARDQWQKDKAACIEAAADEGRTISTEEEWLQYCLDVYDEFGIEPEVD